MKLLVFIACMSSSLLLFSQKKVNVTVNWTFLNVVDGYDHENKVVVTVDGKLYGESKVFKQTEKASYVISVPKGKHAIKVEDYAFYNGIWEPHTKANQYSVDAFYDGVLSCGRGTTISMVFDIDLETSDIQTGNGKKPRSVSLAIAWQYTNVAEGFDHDNRMLVYVDGKLAATSSVYSESKKGTVALKVPAGNHTISIENYAYYEGEWELHSLENGYSLDAFYKAKLEFEKKKRTVTLIFDIVTESSNVVVN